MPDHRLNAELRKLPACPECGVPALCACRNSQGFTCHPHRSRERVAAGELFAITASDARAAHQLRAIRELAATINRKAVRAAQEPSPATSEPNGGRR